MFKKNKIFSLVPVIIAIGVIFWITNGKQKNQPITKTDNNQRTFILNSPIQFDSPVKINWNIKNWTVPNESKVLLLNKPVLDKNEMGIFVKSLGMNYENKKANDFGLITFTDSSELRHIIIDTKNYSYDYNENINNKSQVAADVKLSQEQIKYKFYEYVIKNFNIDSNFQIKIKEENYKQLIFPEWITSDEKNADAVEIRAVYNYQGNLVKPYGNYPISATYTLGGKLVKFYLQKPFIVKSKSQILTSRKLEDLNHLPMAEFKILEIGGNKDYELAANQEKIKEVNINNAYEEYLYDSQQNQAVPYIILEGNSLTTFGPLKVTLGVKAIEN